MSKRKGVSAEEKRIRMLQLFHEKKEFFQMKELEKIAPKEKGIIAQSVQEVVQNLVDDGLVDTDKIGTCVYFWAYPSKLKRLFEDLAAKLEESNTKLLKMKEAIENSKIGRENCSQRESLLDSIAELQAERITLLNGIKKYCDNDPEVLEQKEKDSKLAIEAANRWTDNIYAFKAWCKNKFNIEEEALNKQFDIPAELEYLE